MAEISVDSFFLSVLQVHFNVQTAVESGIRKDASGPLLRFDREETYLSTFMPLVVMEAQEVLRGMVREQTRFAGSTVRMVCMSVSPHSSNSELVVYTLSLPEGRRAAYEFGRDDLIAVFSGESRIEHTRALLEETHDLGIVVTAPTLHHRYCPYLYIPTANIHTYTHTHTHAYIKISFCSRFNKAGEKAVPVMKVLFRSAGHQRVVEEGRPVSVQLVASLSTHVREVAAVSSIISPTLVPLGSYLMKAAPVISVHKLNRFDGDLVGALKNYEALASSVEGR